MLLTETPGTGRRRRGAYAGPTEEREAFRARLSEGHPLAAMLREHDRILAALDRLDELAALPRLDHAALDEARAAAEVVAASEPHRQREELVLYPALREHGIVLPLRVMEAEHAEVRRLEWTVAGLARTAAQRGSARPPLRRAVRALVAVLGAHVAKEESVLYPLALEAVPAREWPALAERCDAIGYGADAATSTGA